MRIDNGTVFFDLADMHYLSAVGLPQATEEALGHWAAHGSFPFLRDAHQLSAFFGINCKKLFDMVRHPEQYYHLAEIPKHSGGIRVLHVPEHSLKVMQRRILRDILMRFSPSEYASAYVRRRMLVQHAAPHTGKRYLLRLDIKNFFGSIRAEQVYRAAFHNGLFSRQVGWMLTALCCLNNSLPQGAPTSPALSNLIMKRFDQELGRWCGERGIAYTRYCDDMVFSADRSLAPVYKKGKAMLSEMGFALNKGKTRFVSNAGRQSVTGLTVNERVAVAKDYKRQLRQEIHYALKFGAEDAIRHTGRQDFFTDGEPDPERYFRHLSGRVQFVLQIEPGNRWFWEAAKKLQHNKF